MLAWFRLLETLFSRSFSDKNIARMLQCTIHIGRGAEPGSLAPAAPLYHTRTMHILIFDLRACSLCSSAPSPNSMSKSDRRSFDRPCESEKINFEMGVWGDAAPRQSFPACRHLREWYDIHSIIRRTCTLGIKHQRSNFNVHHFLMLPLLS